MLSFDPDVILANDLAVMLCLFPATILFPSNEEVSSVFSNIYVRGIDGNTSQSVFSEDFETILWRLAQREEDNLLYQGRLDPNTKYCDDLERGLSIVEFRQAKQP
jgi:hypothetical protein